MTNKMTITWTCNGAAGSTKEIEPPEINKLCPRCNKKMVLFKGIGFHNSGTHTLSAKCPACNKIENFKDYELWKECLNKALKK